MNVRRNSEYRGVTRREALGSLAVAAATAAVPGNLWARPEARSDDSLSECLWFAQECSRDLFRAYAVEETSNGTLWVEYDDGYLHAFAPGEWSLEKLDHAHCLWVREAEDAWSGYECMTQSEAETLLEELV